MEDSQLKIVNISGKGFKKQLLISSKEVSTLHTFLKEIINDKVMIINTNVGLDVYYHSSVCYKDLIVNAFLLLTTCSGKSINDFYIKSLSSLTDIESETNRFFEKLIKNPLLFKSYTKSLFNQLKMNYSNNTELIDELLALWQNKILETNLGSNILKVMMPYIINLQGTYFDTLNQPILKSLARETLKDARFN
ncbi:hypothetical protein [Confluentibacter citreus]|uniref:hypothetical protein n=1 Tax=Confluentibacter citreus TaxID=2007307 RepID=UPI000C28C57A|nr:hypothetical protein [Confluentibacter citreus]